MKKLHPIEVECQNWNPDEQQWTEQKIKIYPSITHQNRYHHSKEHSKYYKNDYKFAENGLEMSKLWPNEEINVFKIFSRTDLKSGIEPHLDWWNRYHHKKVRSKTYEIDY